MPGLLMDSVHNLSDEMGVFGIHLPLGVSRNLPPLGERFQLGQP